MELKAPKYPESVADGTLMTWYKSEGDAVARDEKLADIETDKVVLEVAAPEAGVLTNLRKKEGDTVLDGEVLATINEEGAAAPASTPAAEPPADATPPPPADVAPAPPRAAPVEPAAAGKDKKAGPSAPALSPAVRKLLAEHDLDPAAVTGSGRKGRITKADVERHIKEAAPSPPQAAPPPATPSPAATATAAADGRPRERVPMSRLRARIAERLVQVQQQTAMLTTFNDVNMQPIMELRGRLKERFEKEHGVKLGFMSFFVKAAVEALRQFPAVNASVEGQEIVYHGFYDIGIAVSTDRGLMVPVLREADLLSFAEIESGIATYAERAREGKITLEELTGGTFTITNGGVFGSLLSTPILNPPQSAILGMHKIDDRPVAEEGHVVIRPMMYLALSYDHRIIDGRDAVRFLVAIKEILEDPARLLLQV